MQILFLCPHNAAKSVLAAVYFNAQAAESNLPFTAVSAGTEPSEQISPKVAELLQSEGFDVSGHVPRAVTAAEIASAHRVISMGCDLSEYGLSADKLESWDDVPAASQDLMGARAAIQRHLDALLTTLSETSEPK